ncbi:MAG: nuclear transport factor 2 family protein [Pseudomonadales bacterium]|jgi:hypothetical protein|nr:nuclear transport factor 2 family protein [Pseudomonadales bacterium]
MQAITENTSELWIAKHQICDLQKRYAIATDLLTTNTAENITAATATYQQIFTPNAEIHAAGVDTQIGPEAWVALVLSALDSFTVTQHFIGTQLANVYELPTQSSTRGAGQLTSHLQAWHAKANGDMWHFIGTYEASVVHSRDAGWQIDTMHLIKTSEDYRQILPRPEGT